MLEEAGVFAVAVAVAVAPNIEWLVQGPRGDVA